MPSKHFILCCPFSSYPQSFSASVSFPLSQLFISGPRHWSFSFSTCPSINIQHWFLLGSTGLISLLSKGLSRVFSSNTVRKHQFFGVHICTWLLEKPQLWLYGPLLANWCLCFLICCLGYHSFSSKEQASFDLMAAVTIHSDFGAQNNKVCRYFISPPSICHEVMGPDAMILVFWMLSFKATFSLSSFSELYLPQTPHSLPSCFVEDLIGMSSFQWGGISQINLIKLHFAQLTHPISLPCFYFLLKYSLLQMCVFLCVYISVCMCVWLCVWGGGDPTHTTKQFLDISRVSEN